MPSAGVIDRNRSYERAYQMIIVQPFHIGLAMIYNDTLKEWIDDAETGVVVDDIDREDIGQGGE